MKKIITTSSILALFASAVMATEDIVYSGSTNSIDEYTTFGSVDAGTKVYVTDGSNMTFQGRGSTGKSGIENVDIFVQNGSTLSIGGHDANQCWTANSYFIDETSKITFKQTNAQSKITGNSTLYVKGILSKENYGAKSSIAMNEGAHIVVDGGTISSASYAIGGVIDVVNGGKFIADDTSRVTDLGGDFTGVNYYGTRTEVNVHNSSFDIAGTINVGLRANSTTNKDAILNLENATANVGGNLNIGWNSASYSSSNPDSGKGYVSVEGTTKLDVVGDINIAYQATSGTRNANIGVLSVGADASIKATNINIGEKGSMFITLNDSANQIDATINNAGTLSVTANSKLASGDYTIALNGLNNDANAIVKSYGGTISGNIFTVASVKQLEVNTATPVTVENNGRVNITAEGETIVSMAFNSESANVNNISDTTDSLVSSIGADFVEMGAYSFDVSMDSGDTVVLSFYIGNSSLTANDFSIFHKGNSGKWGKADDVSNIAYDGEFLSFVVSHFSEYGYAAVPEPAEWAAIFGAIALGFAIYRRRK